METKNKDMWGRFHYNDKTYGERGPQKGNICGEESAEKNENMWGS